MPQDTPSRAHPAPSPRAAGHDAARRQACIDLAAAFRLAVRHDFHEGIDNHFTLTVPGAPDRFLLNPFGLHWSEVRASHLIEVDFAGRVVAGEGLAEISAVCIHGPIHRLVPNAACVLHTHMPYITALTQLEDMTLEMTGQTAIGFAGDIAYDRDYTGLAFAPAEGERMAAVMGGRPILMLANHGVIVTGSSVAQAWSRLYFLERAARTQLFSMWTGKPRRIVPPEIVGKTKAQFDGDNAQGGIEAHDHLFTALKRLLDRSEPDYAG